MKRIVFTDLDGTLFNSKGEISTRNYQTLVELGEQGVIRVIVTGRSIYSAQKSLAKDFPIDYLIVSSGAGVLNFKSGEILAKKEIDVATVEDTISFLKELNVDFMVHEPIPNNHVFDYHRSTNKVIDARRRIAIYKEFAKPLEAVYSKTATQILAIVTDEKYVEIVRKHLPHLSVIRATSPLDHKSIWIEIFPKKVDKGYACLKVISKLGFNKEEVCVIGNDFNDLAMLDVFADSFVVANAHQELKEKFRTVASNDEDGFTEVIKLFIDLKD